MAVQYAYIGQIRNINIYGWPFLTWKLIFDSCFAWEWIDKNNGNFKFIDWPMPGSVMKQYHPVIEILNVIKAEAKKIILKG